MHGVCQTGDELRKVEHYAWLFRLHISQTPAAVAPVFFVKRKTKKGCNLQTHFLGHLRNNLPYWLRNSNEPRHKDQTYPKMWRLHVFWPL